MSVADYLSSNMSDQKFYILEYKINYIVWMLESFSSRSIIFKQEWYCDLIYLSLEVHNKAVISNMKQSIWPGQRWTLIGGSTQIFSEPYPASLPNDDDVGVKLFCWCAGWRLSPGQSSLCASWETSSTVTRPKPLNCHTWTSRLLRSSTRTKSWSRSLVWSWRSDP